MVKSMMTYLIEHIDVNIGFYKTMFSIGKVFNVAREVTYADSKSSKRI